jgi:hypothetical protein
MFYSYFFAIWILEESESLSSQVVVIRRLMVGNCWLWGKHEVNFSIFFLQRSTKVFYHLQLYIEIHCQEIKIKNLMRNITGPTFKNKLLGWQSGSSDRACLASVRPWVQTSKKEWIIHLGLKIAEVNVNWITYEWKYLQRTIARG